MSAGTEIRRFSWDGLEAFTGLFNAVFDCEATPSAYSPRLMRERLEDPSCAPERDILLASFDGAPAGFLHVSPELMIDRAVVTGGILDAYRGMGIESSLIAAAVDHAVSLGAGALHVRAPSSDRDAHQALRSAGFETARDYWDMRWEAADAPEIELPKGYTLRPFTLDRDEEALTELQNSAFDGTWGFCPNTVEQISARVRMDRSDPDGIMFILHSGRKAAYCWTTRAQNRFGSIGWISMVGVRPEYRGRGVGKAAVAAGMSYLQAGGVEAVELEVDSQNVAALAAYVKLGFRKTSETLWFERRLD